LSKINQIWEHLQANQLSIVELSMWGDSVLKLCSYLEEFGERWQIVFWETLDDHLKWRLSDYDIKLNTIFAAETDEKIDIRDALKHSGQYLIVLCVLEAPRSSGKLGTDAYADYYVALGG
jgi:hypothetical protein